MDHLSLYKGFGSFLILSFTSSSVRCDFTRVFLPMIFSLFFTNDHLAKNHTTNRKVVSVSSLEFHLPTLASYTWLSGTLFVQIV